MKQLFQVIGLIGLLFFSFFLNEKTKTVIKNLDDIMVQIKKNKSKYEFDGINATIKEIFIIPGISKRIVDVDKSYRKMKKYGKYDDDYYVYNYKLPKINLNNNRDKIIISGNKTRKFISVNFLVNDVNEIKRIIEVLNNNGIKATFFLKEKLLNSNIKFFYNIVRNSFLIGTFDNDEYTVKIIKNVINQPNIYYLAKDDKICKINGVYNISGIYIDNDYYRKVTEKLKNGSIFLLNYSNNLINELDYIIKYILNRGYFIVDLDTHIME